MICRHVFFGPLFLVSFFYPSIWSLFSFGVPSSIAILRQQALRLEADPMTRTPRAPIRLAFFALLRLSSLSMSL